MTYQVLARKWRPQQFDQVVGQDQTVQALTNALDRESLHHALLFTGTRGVGKTTIARIIAKCLNCEVNVLSKPCGQCPACEEINANRFVDLIEVDAASRTKVEDTREILENVQYAPTKGRYKVYLIDEVHMLSGHSFNALLKTLEEPPPHVIFLLATTDPQKLPATILSRCLQFHLMHVPVDKLVAHLSHVLTEEKQAFDEEALTLIAQAACGSVRDALSLLDQAIAYGDGSVRTEPTKSMLGTIDNDDLLRLLSALADDQGDKLIQAIDALEQKGVQMDQALTDLLRMLHTITLQQVAGIETTQELNALADQIKPADCQLYYQIGIQGQQELPFAPTPRIGFEMTLLRMLAFVPLDHTPPAASASGNSRSSSTKPGTTPSAARGQAAPSKGTAKKPAPATPLNNKASSSQKQQGTQAEPAGNSASANQANNPAAPNIEANSWDGILPLLKLTGPTHAFASHCQLIDMDPDNKQLTLALSPNHKPLLNKKHINRIEIALKNHYSTPYTVHVRVEEATGSTPSDLEKVRSQAKLNNMEAQIKQDENVQKIMQTFNATIVEGSMKASESSKETLK